MNQWVANSRQIALAPGYLDRLHEIYPVGEALARDIETKEKAMLEEARYALKKRSSKKLILALIHLKKFPIDDPYVGFIRKDPKALDRNPKTLKRISRRLLKLDYEGILAGATRPKSASTRWGNSFRNWVFGLGYPVLPVVEFIKYSKGIAILDGGDKTLMSFAKQNLGYRRKKGLDLVLRKNNRFLLGEAKLITTAGGTQDKSFREAMEFARHQTSKASHISVLDGVVWLDSKNKASLYDSVSSLAQHQTAISALLLKDFIKKF